MPRPPMLLSPRYMFVVSLFGLPYARNSSRRYLEDEVITYTEENPAAQRDEDYVYVYRGDALNEEELFQLSAQEDIKLVLIAGPHL